MERRSFVWGLLGALAISLCAGPTSAAVYRRICVGDCDGDGEVIVGELVTGVNIVLGRLQPSSCVALDANGSGATEVNELVLGVNHVLNGCPLETRADAAFWQTLFATADRADEGIDLLDEAVTANPDDGASWFLLGQLHLYRYGREDTHPATATAATKEEIRLSNVALDRAVELLPEQLGIPGFRGAATYAHGYTTGDAELAALGVEQLRDAIALWPLFNRFSFFGPIAQYEPAGSDLFAEAYQFMRDALTPEGLAECTPALCFNEGRAAHNLEGSGVLFGDIYAKGGDTASARNWYQISAGAGRTSGWRFLALAEERLATVEQRVALYQDDDPANDPAVVGGGEQNCAYCHAR